MQTFINEKFPSDIWRMEIDEVTETLFLEVRNNADRKVSFSGINLATGKTLFNDLTTPERWLTGIEAAYDGVLLLHFYQTETGPAHKGLMAIDGLTRAILWTDYNLTYDHLSVKGPIVYDARIQPRKLVFADIRTGATICPYMPSDLTEHEKNIIVPEIVSAAMLPVQLIDEQPFGNSINYLEYNNFRIVSLHSLKDGLLRQLIYVFSGWELVHHDLLNTGIQKLQPESFIIYRHLLIYIKNKLEIKVLPLN